MGKREQVLARKLQKNLDGIRATVKRRSSSRDRAQRKVNEYRAGITEERAKLERAEISGNTVLIEQAEGYLKEYEDQVEKWEAKYKEDQEAIDSRQSKIDAITSSLDTLKSRGLLK